MLRFGLPITLQLRLGLRLSRCRTLGNFRPGESHPPSRLRPRRRLRTPRSFRPGRSQPPGALRPRRWLRTVRSFRPGESHPPSRLRPPRSFRPGGSRPPGGIRSTARLRTLARRRLLSGFRPGGSHPSSRFQLTATVRLVARFQLTATARLTAMVRLAGMLPWPDRSAIARQAQNMPGRGSCLRSSVRRCRTRRRIPDGALRRRTTRLLRIPRRWSPSLPLPHRRLYRRPMTATVGRSPIP